MTGYWKTGCSKTGDSLGARVGAVQAKCRADRQDRHETKTDRDRPRSVLGPRSVLVEDEKSYMVTKALIATNGVTAIKGN